MTTQQEPKKVTQSKTREMRLMLDSALGQKLVEHSKRLGVSVEALVEAHLNFVTDACVRTNEAGEPVVDQEMVDYVAKSISADAHRQEKLHGPRWRPGHKPIGRMGQVMPSTLNPPSLRKKQKSYR